MATKYRYPTYQHKPSLTSDVYQSGERIDWDKNAIYISRSYIGPDNSILDMANDYRAGSRFDCGNSISGIVTEATTEKLDSDRSRLDLTIKGLYRKNESYDPPPETTTGYTESWSVDMAQMDVPLYRYCSPSATLSSLDYGSASDLRAWEMEEDSAMRSDYKYWHVDTQTDTKTEVVLSGRTLDLAKLKASGVEDRICFYPQVTHTVIYDSVSSMSKDPGPLNYTDPTPAGRICLSGDFYWLKTGYNTETYNDGTGKLVETWIGAPAYLGNWSHGLYDEASHWNMWADELP